MTTQTTGETVTLAERGRVPVPEIASMTQAEIHAEIFIYTDEDLLNADTKDRVARLKEETEPMAVGRIRARQAVAKRLAERRQRRESRLAQCA